jgi:UDP-3-O-[3-hydroxymyristoyl] glucosamine N-acyltransferase
MELNLSLDALAKIINATQYAITKKFTLKNISSIETAGPEDLVVLLERGDASVFDALPTEKIKTCKAAVFLATKPFVAGKSYFLVNDVLTAFTHLVSHLQTNNAKGDEFLVTSTHAYVSKYATVHPTATLAPAVVICAGAVVGEHTIIGAQSFIGNSCHIGAHVLVHPGVKILDHCSVGDGTIIHSGTIIGSDGFGYMVTHQGLRKIPQIGTVTIGNMAEIGANCTIDRASFDQTIIGNGVKLDNSVHVAHNVTIGDGTAILAQTGIAGSTKIGSGCQIGGQVAIKNDLLIGNRVKIVSKSAVMRNLNDGETVCGMPAISFMQWKRLHALNTKLPEWGRVITTIIEHQKLSLWQKIKKLITK